MNRKGIVLLIFILIFTFTLISCSSQEDSQSSNGGEYSSADRAVESTEPSIGLTENKSSMENAVQDQQQESVTEEINTDISSHSANRMVIYNAEVQLRVKNYAKAQQELEQKATEYGGYLVESNTNRYEDEQLSGMMVFRIPQEHFSSFLHNAEDTATEVLNKYVRGQDVTEEFVDLESRLRSKKAVEKRLLDFLDSAEKTEDLLKISSDLSKVQEEIEQLTGRMNYLQNQTSFSTVTVTLEESNILVPNIDNKELNTWQKVKKQLVMNVNWLLSFFSGTIVLIAGNLPILILIALVIGTVVMVIKKQRKRNGHSNK